MPRVISYARQRAKLGISRRTNAAVVRRYRRSRVSKTVYARVKRRRATGNARFRWAIRRIMPTARRRLQKRSAVLAARSAAIYSPRRSRSRSRSKLGASLVAY